ncbi:hypothetical protein H0I39_05545 [Ottowia beijingensis]|uniref:Uncharacterized protein n=1 Tax=Ottowia beijingensis TaxID=1207057 RepID=A0A853IL09_9BURK|nr:hypothetical protein [Ottowia beijingensis]NZA01363.1 hypothetical protein [Ottowia beijingensis]
MALSNLFKKKPQDPALDEGETIAQERLDGQSMAFDSHGPTDSTVMVSTIDEPEEQALPAEEAFAVPCWAPVRRRRTSGCCRYCWPCR